MFEPNFTYIYAPGIGGKVLSHNALYIKSEQQLCTMWGGLIRNPYRDLQFGGITLGYDYKNYWFSLDSFLGRILSFIV